MPALTTDARTPGDRQAGEGLRVAGPNYPVATLDPALTRDLPTMTIVRQIFRGLLRFDASLNAVADLANLIESSEDMIGFVFQLVDGAAFADGRPITSDDVIASYERALNPDTAGGVVDALGAVPYLRGIRGASDVLAGRGTALPGLTIIDERTLGIELDAPDSTFLLRLASVPTAIVDTKQARVAEAAWWQSPNASGPFEIASFTLDAVHLVPNEYYPGQLAHVPSVTFLTGDSASNPFNLFQRGAVDLAPTVSGSDGRLAKDPACAIDADVTSTPLFVTAFIAFGNVEPPLDDVHVRRALQRLIDPGLIAASTFAGGVTPAQGLIPPGMLDRDWPSDMSSPDFAAARNHLAASRYGSGANVPAFSIYAADIEPVEALRDIAADELGMKIEAVMVNWPDFLQGLVERRFAAYSLYWGADYPDPAAFLDMLFRSDGSDNYTGYSNPAFDAILAMARRESDINRRAALYSDAQKLLIEDAAVIPLYHDVSVSLARPGIDGLELTPMGLLGLEAATRKS
jgi:ABC-type transport system substrate-binding protein